MSELSAIESLPAEQLALVLDLLTYSELRVLEKASPELSVAVSDFFSGLRLALPDPSRSSALQLLRGLAPNSGEYRAALGYLLHKGARVIHFTEPDEDALCDSSDEDWGETLRLLAASTDDLHSLVLSCNVMKDFEEQLALAAACPGLRRLRVQVQEGGFLSPELDVPAAPFAFLSSLLQLQSLDLLMRHPMDHAELLGHVPLQQLRRLRLQLWEPEAAHDGIDPARIAEIQYLISSWPTLPSLEDLSFGSYFPPPVLRLSWSKLPGLRSLEGIFSLGPDEAQPTLAALRRLVWGASLYLAQDDAALCRFLIATPALADISFHTGQDLTPELSGTLARLAGTLTSLEVYCEMRAVETPAVLVCKILSLLSRLPRLSDLRLRETSVIQYLVCRDAVPAFGYHAAAAAGRLLRRLSLDLGHRQDQGAGDFESVHQGADLLALILGAPGRPPGLKLTVQLGHEVQAAELKATLAERYPDVAHLVCVNWLGYV